MKSDRAELRCPAMSAANHDLQYIAKSVWTSEHADEQPPHIENIERFLSR